MTVLSVLHYPDSRLHLVAKPVSVFDERLALLVEDMSQTMYHYEGIGLAATQVNVQEKLFIVDISSTEDKKDLQVFINLEILELSGKILSNEGCLSVPTVYESVPRAEKVKVRFQDIKGVWHEKEYEGIMAICIQHENDHLSGKVFIEYLSGLKQNFIKKKMKKLFR